MKWKVHLNYVNSQNIDSMCIWMYVCIYVYIYVCMYVCMYVIVILYKFHFTIYDNIRKDTMIYECNIM